MFRLFFALGLVCAAVFNASAQSAFMTFLNSSPDPELRTVDLYITQAGVTNKVEDVSFQKADNLNSVAIFGDIELVVGVAPGNSIGMADVIAEHAFTPSPDRGYMAVLHGVRNPASYVANPDGKATKLAVTSYEIENTNNDPNKTALFFFHAASDLEKCDFWMRGGSKVAAANIAYTDRNVTAVLVDRKIQTIDCTKPGDKTKVLASFSVDFAQLASSVIVSVVSGFKTPNDNNKSTDTLALLSVLEDGRVVRSPLMAGSQTCRVQLIHAAADPSLTQVDVYLNGTKAADNIAFMKATGFTTVVANSPVVIGLAPATSTSYKDTLLTITLDPLRPTHNYTMVVSGVADTSKFAKNPVGLYAGIRITLQDGALDQADAGKTAVRTGTFVTDATRLTVASSQTSYATKSHYMDVSPEYVNITPAIDTLWIMDTAGVQLKGFVCDLRGTNRATTALAVGFMSPDANQNGMAYKLILVDGNGSVNSSLEELKPGGGTSVLEDVLAQRGWVVGPNPAQTAFHAQIPASEAVQAPSYKLVSTNGGVVRSGQLTLSGTVYAVDATVADLPQGMYQLVVTAADGRHLGTLSMLISR